MHSDMLHRQTFGEAGLQDVFICSFCAHKQDSYEANHGLLSQWRGYGVDGGVAIVLDTRGIEKGMEHERKFSHRINYIGDVTYDDDPDLEKKEDYCQVFNLFPKILRDFYLDKKPTYEQIFEHFVIGSTLVKHRGFHEEREVRIVVAPRPINPASSFYNSQGSESKHIKYRRRGDSEVRYIELFGDAPLPIKRVIVGPSRIQHLNYQSIKECVVESEIDIQMSETPFVG